MTDKNVLPCSSDEEWRNREMLIISSGTSSSVSHLEARLGNDVQQAESLINQLTDSIISGCFDQVLQSDVAKQVLRIGNLDKHLKEAKLSIIIQKLLHNYLDVSDENITQRKWCAFLLGVASLQLFIQNNWTGPAGSKLHLFNCMSETGNETTLEKEKVKQVCDHALVELNIDDSNVYPLLATPGFLLLAKCILVDGVTDIPSCLTGSWWALRCQWTWQLVLDERSPSIYYQIIPLIQKVSENDVLMCKERHADLCVTFQLECSHIFQYYYDYKTSKEHLQSAGVIAGLKVELTGALGKRTKFQNRNLAQLLLKVEKESSRSLENTKKPVKGLPKDLALNDDTLLDAIQLQDTKEGAIPSLSAVEQAVVLALGIERKRNGPKQELLGEEVLAYVNTVLSEPQTWCIHMAALMMRCQLEKDRRRTVERAMMQMQSLVDQWREEECPISDRLQLFFATNLPPKWDMEKLLAGLFVSLGSTSAALEVYLRLHLWEDAVSCYKRLEKLDKAERLIREQLAIKETTLMLCLLGDVTEDPQHYERAWEVSGQRSARAMKSLGLLFVHNKEYDKAIECLEKSLEKNFLQYNAWFLLGFAAIKAERHAVAVRAYQRCVMLDPDDAQSWNNLSSAYIKMKNKVKAFKTLQEALKCNYENWKIWENYLLTSTDLGEFNESIRAYNRLMELKDKYVDEEVLDILVKTVCSDATDAHVAPASDFKKKMVDLFGHLTSCVTSNAQIWSLYAKLHGNGQSDDPLADDKALQCLQKSHRLQSQSTEWVKVVSTCRDVIEKSQHLAQVYIKCSKSKTNAGEAIQLLVSAKLMLKAIISKIRQQDVGESSAWSDLAEPLAHIESTLQTIVEYISQLKGQR